ncbi:MAG: DUF11 domain-containing protein [Planctomycetes bacterium]|nr:DUF11 domain-containing protein [Planctomycetota bacterium]
MRTTLNTTLGRRLIALLLPAALVVLPACKSLPDSFTNFAAFRKQPAAEGAPVDAAAAPAVVPQALAGDAPGQSKLESRILGPKGKPPVGEQLPAMPRAGCEVQGGVPIPFVAHSAWQPPGIKGPWPHDEFLHDGGDAYEPVGVSPEWRVDGLNVEDTVAHYDTLDGRTLVEPSNCTYLYAPRFSSVRTVINASSSEFVDGPTRFKRGERVVNMEERARIGINTENLQPIGQTATTKLTVFARDQRDGILSKALLPYEFKQSFAAFENLTVIRTGIMQGSEKARLAEAVDKAIIWTKDDGLKVAIDKQAAKVATGDQRAQAIYVVNEPTCARLRICKIASTAAANPGDTVDFTIRYDNVGDAPVGNIVILDSLTTRLEYEPGSAQSSRKAHFSTTENAAISLELRWEIEEPLQPGDGGLVRFRCKVR